MLWMVVVIDVVVLLTIAFDYTISLHRTYITTYIDRYILLLLLLLLPMNTKIQKFNGN